MTKLKHFNNPFLDKMRLEADAPADNAVKALFQGMDKANLWQTVSSFKNNSYQLPADLPKPILEYFEQTRYLPDWADEDMILQGQVFFRKQAVNLLNMLGLYALPYCYASGDGAQVLYQSERLQKNTGKRLFETGQFVFDVCSKNSFSDKGNAIVSAQKVRLMHAAIRYHIQKKNAWDSAWGEPVNQEDMAGTNLAMSLITIRGLRKIGIKVSYEEAHAYIHLWNVVGHILGIRNELLPDNGKEAFVLLKLIEDRQIRQSEAGINLTKSLLNTIQNFGDSRFSKLIPGYMRFLLGEPIADVLALPTNGVNQVTIKSFQKINQIKSFISFSQESFFQAYQQLNRQKTIYDISKREVQNRFETPQTLNN